VLLRRIHYGSVSDEIQDADAGILPSIMPGKLNIAANQGG
jgi:hypothetical protein